LNFFFLEGGVPRLWLSKKNSNYEEIAPSLRLKNETAASPIISSVSVVTNTFGIVITWWSFAYEGK
jgi:hypothetical protein